MRGPWPSTWRRTSRWPCLALPSLPRPLAPARLIRNHSAWCGLNPRPIPFDRSLPRTIMPRTITGHRFHPSILREYDIRGIVGETLYEADAEWVGRAYATVLTRQLNRAPVIAVGRDGRLSSPGLHAKLVAGLTAGGANIRDIGIGPTPMLYFSVYHLKTDGGIMVTGSHNPPTHNGFKLMIGRKPFFGAMIQDLGRMVAAGDVVSGNGGREAVSVLADNVAR